jgi:hypothetical protein
MKAFRDTVNQGEYLDYIHGITKELSLMGNDGGELGFRVSGSSGEWKVSRRIRDEMIRIGLSDVQTDEFPVHSWEFLSGRLTLLNEEEGRTFAMSSFCGIKGTGEEGISAEITDVGRGTKFDYGNKDVKGKIVFITLDILEDFWISLPVRQAELRGAVACVIAYKGDGYGTRDDALNSFDSQCRHGIPVGNISRKDANTLRKLLTDKPVAANLKLDVKVDMHGKSSNVFGMIPGESKDRYIMIGGHMDGYFHSYQDDLLGVGISLAIAKAVIETNFKPKHTIIVMAHGSEEYGVTESRYDWCIGSWYSINRLRPDWQGKIKAFLNIDAIRPGTPKYTVNATSELSDFFSELFENISIPPDSWPGGLKLAGLNGPWSDDYNYAIRGVPAVICGRGPADWSYRNYHTQFDDHTIFEDEKEIVAFVFENYAEIISKLDEHVLPPFGFQSVMRGLIDSFDAIAQDHALSETEELKRAAADTGELSSDLYKRIIGANKACREGLIAEEALLPAHDALMSVYRLIEDELMKLSPWDDVVFPHACVGDNIASLEKAVAFAKTREIEKAYSQLRHVDLFGVAMDFDRQVFSWLMDLQDAQRQDLFWGTGKVHPMIRADSLIENIEEHRGRGDFEGIAQSIENVLADEIRLYGEIIQRELALLRKIQSVLETISLPHTA